jgi:hypothetical protein
LTLGYFNDGQWKASIQANQNGPASGILLLNPSGGATSIGTTQAPSTVTVNGGPQLLRMVYSGGTYGVIQYIDAGNFYFLLTNANDPWGGFNGLRPFIITLATGGVTMSQAVTMNSTCSVGSNLSVSGPCVVSGNLTASSNLFVTGQMTVGPAYSNQAGDLGVARTSAPTSGVVFFGNTQQYLFYDGSDFYLTKSLKITGNCTVSGAYLTSDARLKQNIRDLTGGLSFIEKLKPREFEWNGVAGTPAGQHAVSLIAQELQAVSPSSVSIFKTAKVAARDPEPMDFLSYNQTEIIMHLVLSVQQLQKQLRELKTVN